MKVVIFVLCLILHVNPKLAKIIAKNKNRSILNRKTKNQPHRFKNNDNKPDIHQKSINQPKIVQKNESTNQISTNLKDTNESVIFEECLNIINNQQKPIFKFKQILDPNVIFLINSIPSEFQTRCAIRSSWSHISEKYYNPDISYGVIFQIGKSNNYNLSNLYYENKIFNDIFIHSHIFDDYKKLTHKNIASWMIIQNKFPNSKMIVKSDSDVFVNIELYLNHLFQIMNTEVYYEGYKFRHFKL